MAILVVGGAGYIGSHAARALRRAGYEVIIYDNLSRGHRRLAAGFELIEGDLGDPAALRPALARVDAVMHFASFIQVGESVREPAKYYRNNVAATLSLLESMVRNKVLRFIFSSTAVKCRSDPFQNCKCAFHVHDYLSDHRRRTSENAARQNSP